MVSARRYTRFLIPALLVLFTAACAPSATVLKGSINTSLDLNPDHTGRPSPVVLRIYELRAAGRFQGADFFALYDQDGATLGPDLIAREEIELQPGSVQALNRTLQADTHFVAVLAAFRDIENATWRGIVEIPPGKSPSLTIRLDSLSVSISSDR
jgi:type VI secretion system protein VasD